MKEKDLQVWPDEVPADFPSLEAGGNEDWIEVPPEDMPSDLPDDWALPVGGEFEPDAFFEASVADDLAPVAEDFAPAAVEPAQSGAADPQTDDDPNGDFKLLDDPLRGRTLIEASAGTGKTYSLEHIVLRLVVERGIAIGRMLVVTFTKAATAELKSRIRGKLIAVRNLVTEGVPPTDKNLFEQFERWKKLELDPDLVRERLDRAVREFDDAVILTIHSFCQKTLSDFVFTSGGSYGVDSGEENDLLDRTAEEFLRLEARRANESGATAAFRALRTLKLDKALSKLAAEPESARSRAVFSEEGFPKNLDAENAAAYEEMLSRFLTWAPARYEALKREASYQTFDDMLVRAEAGLKADPAFAAVVRSHYDVVLIDEFQDTDPLQYGIFSTLFGDPAYGKTVFFVGDPKQAIYSFRNADFETYRKASDEIGRHRKLAKNFRTTPVLMHFFNLFFERPGTFLGSGIRYDAVAANEDRPPLIRVDENGVFRPEPALVVRLGDFEKPVKDKLFQWEADDIADEIAAMLSERDRHFVKGRPLRPGDIAILVRTRDDGMPLYDALLARGVKVRFPSDKNVFGTEEAKELCTVLEAMAMPSERGFLEAARATRIVGDGLSTYTDEKKRTERLVFLRGVMEAAAERARRSGLTAAFGELFRVCEVERRLLPVAGGERALANYRQLIELLFGMQQSAKTLSGLVRRFEKLIAKGSDKKASVPDEYKVRPDSNDDRVVIQTIHSSKGLEYPIVYLPGCWWGAPYKDMAVPMVHERDGAGERRLVLFPGEVKPNDLPDFKRAQIEESVRLLYVAFTRASARLTIYGLPKWKVGGELNSYAWSAFFYALAARENLAGWTRDDYLAVWDEFQKGMLGSADDFADVWAKTAGRFAEEHPGMTVDSETLKPQKDETGLYWSISPWAPREDGVPVMLESPEAQALPEPESVRRVDPSWVQTSYTALKKGLFGAHADALRDERATLSGEDETEDDESQELRRRIEDASPMARWRSGAALGVTIHRLFEVVDFHGFECRRVLATDEELADPGLSDEIRRNRLRQRNYLLSILGATPDLVRRGEGLSDEAPGEDRLSPEGAKRLEELRTLFDSVLSLPILPDFCLKNLKAECRRSEYGFLLHTKPNLPKGAFAKKAAELGWKGLTQEELSGYLTGSIDLLFEANGKIWILDWKTDNLASNAALREAFPEAKDWRDFYAEDAVALHMKEAHYDIQYLCYLAAAKRLLRARLGEGAEDRLGGALYFFVRGASAGRGVAVLPYEDVADRVKILEEMLGD